MQKVLVFDSDPRALKPLREKLKPFLDQAGLSEKGREEVLVAVGEACTNAIRHSYLGEKGHKIRVTLHDQREKLVLKIRDYGRKIDLSRVKAPELPPKKAGGLGIYFMKTIMDEMEYNTRHRQGNELILTKYKGKGETNEDRVPKRRAGRSDRRS